MIELTPLQRDAHFVVVAMWVLAFTAVISQVVSRSKAIFYRNFVHDSSGLFSQKEITQKLGFPAIRGVQSRSEDWPYCIAMLVWWASTLTGSKTVIDTKHSADSREEKEENATGYPEAMQQFGIGGSSSRSREQRDTDLCAPAQTDDRRHKQGDRCRPKKSYSGEKVHSRDFSQAREPVIAEERGKRTTRAPFPGGP